MSDELVEFPAIVQKIEWVQPLVIQSTGLG